MRTFEDLPNPNDRFGYIKKKWDSDYLVNQSILGIMWSEASTNARLECGDTSRAIGFGITAVPGQPSAQVSLNRVRPTLGFIGGWQRKNRKSTIVIPVENASQQTADQQTRLLLALYKNENVQETLSRSFYNGACVSGLDFLHLYLDFRNDPVNGDLKVESVPLTYMFFDPYFRNMDFSDCSFMTRRSYVTHATAGSLVPDSEFDRVMSLQSNAMGVGRDGRFQYVMENQGQAPRSLLAYDEYYYRDYRKQRMLVDKINGDMLDISYNKNVDVNQFLFDNPDVELITQNVPTVRLAILIQDDVFWDGHQPLLIDDYPFVGSYGFFNTIMPSVYNRIQSVAYSLRDAQILYNQRVTLTSDYIQSVVNSGWIFKENAILDVNHLFQTGNGRIIPVKREANIATDVVQIQPPPIPAGFFQLGEVYGQQFNLVTGVNEEMLGAATQDVAALLASYRQGAGLTTLQSLFDNFDFTVKRLGDIFLRAIKMNYTPAKVKRILGGEELSPYFYDKEFGKYQCQVQLGFDTESQKQMAFAQIVQLKQLGYDIPASYAIGEAALQNKDKLMQFFQQQEQAQSQAQQVASQMQMQEAQARIELTQATAMANKGMAAERISRIEDNKAQAEERKSKAVNEDYEAILNYAKALRELELIEADIKTRDIAHLENLLRLKREEKEPDHNDQQSI